MSPLRCSSEMGCTKARIPWVATWHLVTIAWSSLYRSSWNGKIRSLRVWVSVAVIARLSSQPFLDTCLVPFFAIVILSTLTYFDGVWSTFSINSSGISYWRTASAISCKKMCLISSNMTRVIAGRDVVAQIIYPTVTNFKIQVSAPFCNIGLYQSHKHPKNNISIDRTTGCS